MNLDGEKLKFNLILENLRDNGYYRGSSLTDDASVKECSRLRHIETIGPIRNPADATKVNWYHQELFLAICVDEENELYYSIKSRITPKIFPGGEPFLTPWGKEKKYSTFEKFLIGLNDSIEENSSIYELSKKGIFKLEQAS